MKQLLIIFACVLALPAFGASHCEMGEIAVCKSQNLTAILCNGGHGTDKVVLLDQNQSFILRDSVERIKDERSFFSYSNKYGGVAMQFAMKEGPTQGTITYSVDKVSAICEIKEWIWD